MRSFFRNACYLLPVICCLSIPSCDNKQNKIHSSFYYWKTNYHVSTALASQLNEAGIRKIYLRFFDVIWDDETQGPAPVALVGFANSPSDSFEYVPVAFVTNEVLELIPVEKINSLSENILLQIKRHAGNNGMSYTELQLDCDWTEGTKGKYLALVEQVKTALHAENKTLSVTIRLHQVKYASRTGVPDCDRGMLMFYNMGEIGDKEKNSIFNEEDASKYTAFIKDYPLPLDVALPFFSWTIQERNGKPVDLISGTGEEEMLATGFVYTSPAGLKAKKGFFINGHYIRENDVLRFENADLYLCKSAGELLSKNLNPVERSVVLFDLDKGIFHENRKEDIQEVFDLFR